MRGVTIGKVDVRGVRVNARGDWLFVRLETREGHVGLGELSHSGDDVRAALLVQQLAPVLVGEALPGIEPSVDALRARLPGKGALDRVEATVVSALEQALWDVTARTLGVSVQALLGGPRRTSIPLYANINRALTDRSSDAFASAARRAVDDGFEAIKVAPFDGVGRLDASPRAVRAALREGVERVAAVRAAIGPDVALMVDCHGRFTRELAVEAARALEPFDLTWLEDLLWAEDDPDGVAAVGAAIRQPQAAGERTLTLEGFFPIVAHRLAATVMPDVKHCGGLGAARRIAALAEAGRLHVSPHNPAGPVATLVSAHLSATLERFVHLEYAWGEVPFRAQLLDPAERIVAGRLVLPEGLGFGAALREDVLAEHGFDPLDRARRATH